MTAPADNAAAGSQPHALPVIRNWDRAPMGNYQVGRYGHRVSLFVRHNTESQGTGDVPSLAWFLSLQSGRSIHHLVGRDGMRHDLVHRSDTAYHVGDGEWGGYHGSEHGIGVLNLISLGMEFESSASVAGAGDGYTDPQLWTGAYTEACTIVSYGLPAAACVNHADIALPAGRRHDPSAFPWGTYLPRVAAWVTFLRSLPAVELPRWCL